MGKMKELAIDLANRDRETEKLLGISMEELEKETNEIITTTKSELRFALLDVAKKVLEISGKHLVEVELGKWQEVGKEGEIAEETVKVVQNCLKGFPTLGEKLNNL